MAIPMRNVHLGDIVVVQDEALFSCKWPFGRVIEVHKGKNELVQVMTVKMKSGIYRRLITKIVILLPEEKDK